MVGRTGSFGGSTSKAHERGKDALLGGAASNVLLQRLADDACGRTSLATGDSLQFSQKSGVEED
jgi:hypothetical protein